LRNDANLLKEQPVERVWKKIYGDKIPAEIDLSRYSSVVAMLDEAMTRFRQRTAFVSFANRLSYADVDRLSRQFAAYLQSKLGVRKGDRVAMMAPNFGAVTLITGRASRVALITWGAITAAAASASRSGRKRLIGSPRVRSGRFGCTHRRSRTPGPAARFHETFRPS